jgi:hypothetical protein
MDLPDLLAHWVHKDLVVRSVLVESVVYQAFLQTVVSVVNQVHQEQLAHKDLVENLDHLVHRVQMEGVENLAVPVARDREANLVQVDQQVQRDQREQEAWAEREVELDLQDHWALEENLALMDSLVCFMTHSLHQCYLISKQYNIVSVDL